MAKAGRILIIPKGTYDASATYEMLDLVSYNGTSWLARKTSVGIEPSDANAEYWQNMFGISREEIEGKVSRKLLWSGDGVSDGMIECTGQDAYQEFEILCNDGCMLHGYKVYNEAQARHQIQCGYCGVIGMGEGKYGHGSYAGLIDVYPTHFYVQGISMHIIPTGEYYEGKKISKIYGIR